MERISGIVSEIQRYCIHDGQGIRTNIFLKGCPLQCAWCSNPETQLFEKELMYMKRKCLACLDCIKACPEHALTYDDERGIIIAREKCIACGTCVKECIPQALKLVGREMTVAEVMDEVLKDQVFFKRSNGGMTISGGEALSQPEFTLALVKTAKKLSIDTVIETSGFGKKETLLELGRLADKIFFDIKLANTKEHEKWIGASNGIIWDNLKSLLEESRNVLIRIPVVEGVNNSQEKMEEIADRLSAISRQLQVELLPFHRLGADKYTALQRNFPLEGMERMNKEDIEPLLRIFHDRGIDALVT